MVFILGASWDLLKIKIKEQEPKVLWYEMPCIWLKLIVKMH